MALLVFSTTKPDLARLVRFENLTGVEGGFWPRIESAPLVFLSGLLLTVALGLVARLAVFWWVLGERHRFRGPPGLGQRG